MAKREPQLIGHIGVDAGLCWIGDPCYVLPDNAQHNPGANWDEFCASILSGPTKSFSHKEFPEGVCVGTGHGDGEYPVYADIDKNGVVHSVTVQFISK